MKVGVEGIEGGWRSWWWSINKIIGKKWKNQYWKPSIFHLPDPDFCVASGPCWRVETGVSTKNKHLGQRRGPLFQSHLRADRSRLNVIDICILWMSQVKNTFFFSWSHFDKVVLFSCGIFKLQLYKNIKK